MNTDSPVGNEPAKLVEHSERLTNIFGYWPSFHDAEVIEFALWRGDVDPEKDRYIGPVLTTKIHLWELTCEMDTTGHCVLRHETLAVLRFHEMEDLQFEGFNHQNAIYGLSITAEPRKDLPDAIRVEFEPAFGLTGTFRCSRIEVVSAEPYPRNEQRQA